MLRNFLTLAKRNFTRQKLFSSINILCLSIGITFSMLIGVYILNQQAVNSGLNNVENQYILKSIYKQKDLGLDIVSISPLAKAAKETYPGLIANYYRYNPATNVVSSGDKHFKEEIAIGDTTLVSMYGFPLLYGDKTKAFSDNNSAVITESFALKLFGVKNSVGKRLTVQTTVAGVTQDYLVSAVLRDIPYNTVTNLVGDTYSVYLPTEGNRYFAGGDASLSWDNTNYVSFLQLRPQVHPASVIPLLNRLLKQRSSDFIWKNLSADMLPVKDYYLNNNNGAVRKMIFVLSLIATFILLMVIINYVNINIGTSFGRLKEIGLRKTFGSLRKWVMLQFMVESFILTLVAAFISLVLYQLSLPLFSKVLNAKLTSVWQLGLHEYVLFFSLVIITGVLSGIYPAFVLSGTNLIQAVKGKITGSKSELTLKRTLLVVQFSLAALVFICTLNVTKQLTYVFNKDLGYSKDQLLVITAFPKQWDSIGVAKMQSIKESLLQLSFVKSASLTYELPERVPVGRIILYPIKSSGIQEQLNLPIATADEDYAKTFGIKMKAGSFFEDTKDGIVLNETAVKQLGLSVEKAIGQKIETGAVGAPLTITGVMNDYNYSTMQDKIGAIGFAHTKSQNTYRFMVLKLNVEDVSWAINLIKKKWWSFVPAAPFDYTFMDEKFALLYKAELQFKIAANIATILNFLIVLLGIVGVVAFMLNKKTKEIAIRKALGANPGNIIFLFLKEYAMLILIANIIAWPFAYVITENLLQNFAYRIEQNIYPYLLVLMFISFVAFLLISVQCLKIAVAKPVKGLRIE